MTPLQWHFLLNFHNPKFNFCKYGCSQLYSTLFCSVCFAKSFCFFFFFLLDWHALSCRDPYQFKNLITSLIRHHRSKQNYKWMPPSNKCWTQWEGKCCNQLEVCRIYFGTFRKNSKMVQCYLKINKISGYCTPSKPDKYNTISAKHGIHNELKYVLS